MGKARAFAWRLQVQGDEVSGYRVYVHLPEEWVRVQQQKTLAGSLRGAAFGVVLLGVCFAILAAVFRGMKHPAMQAVPWRLLARNLLVVAIAAGVYFKTSGPQSLLTYPTSQPLTIYIASLVIAFTLGSVLIYSLTVLLFGLACYFLIRAYGESSLPIGGGKPTAYYRDAFCIALGGGFAVLGLASLSQKFAQLWSVNRYEFPARLPGGLDPQLPALHALAASLWRGFAFAAGLALVLAFAAYFAQQKRWLGGPTQTVFLAVLAMLAVPRSGSAGDFVLSAALAFAGFAVIWWGARCLVRLNLLGYLLLVVLLLLVAPAADLLRQPNPFFREHGLALAAMIVLLLLWPLVRWRSAASGEAAAAGGGTAGPGAVG